MPKNLYMILVLMYRRVQILKLTRLQASRLLLWRFHCRAGLGSHNPATHHKVELALVHELVFVIKLDKALLKDIDLFLSS